MANRKLPFGYEMRRGKICIHAQEADIVREIYTAYADGSSYQQLARSLNNRQLPYSEPDKPWNKNMIARILSNEVYTGNESYPAIISAAERQRAIYAKPSVGISDSSRTAKAIRRMSRCAACGGKLTLSENKYGWARWNCPDCVALTADASTPAILNSINDILTAVVKDPEAVQAIPQNHSHSSEKVSQLEAELSDALNGSDFDEAAAKHKAIALASARFDSLCSEDYEIMRVQYILRKTEQHGDLDTELLRQITSDVLIHPHGAVSLRLKNGQILKRSDL